MFLLISSSARSSDMDNTRRMSELLWMVVEQLICAPRKKLTRPSEFNNGARSSQSSRSSRRIRFSVPTYSRFQKGSPLFR